VRTEDVAPSGRALAQKEQGPEFIPQFCEKKKKKRYGWLGM
jgi:hypothetical protein